MDTIKINTLTIETQIGCLAWEKQVQQTLIVDVEYGTDFSSIAKRDEIQNAICYASIADHITTFGANTQVQLVETWISQLADSLLTHFAMDRVSLSVQKRGHISNAHSVTFHLTRTK